MARKNIRYQIFIFFILTGRTLNIRLLSSSDGQKEYQIFIFFILTGRTLNIRFLSSSDGQEEHQILDFYLLQIDRKNILSSSDGQEEHQILDFCLLQMVRKNIKYQVSIFFRWSGRILNIRLLSSSDGQEEQEMHIKRVFFRKFQLSPITVSSKLKNVIRVLEEKYDLSKFFFVCILFSLLCSLQNNRIWQQSLFVYRQMLQCIVNYSLTYNNIKMIMSEAPF